MLLRYGYHQRFCERSSRTFWIWFLVSSTIMLNFSTVHSWEYEIDVEEDIDTRILDLRRLGAITYYKDQASTCNGMEGIPEGDYRDTMGFWVFCNAQPGYIYITPPRDLISFRLELYHKMNAVLTIRSDSATIATLTGEDNWMSQNISFTTGIPNLLSIEAYSRVNGAFPIIDKMAFEFADPDITTITTSTTTTTTTTTTELPFTLPLPDATGEFWTFSNPLLVALYTILLLFALTIALALILWLIRKRGRNKAPATTSLDDKLTPNYLFSIYAATHYYSNAPHLKNGPGMTYLPSSPFRSEKYTRTPRPTSRAFGYGAGAQYLPRLVRNTNRAQVMP